MTTTLSSRDFNQDTARAKRAAALGPVIITDRGEPSHVLLSIEAFRKLTASPQSIVDLIGDPVAGAIDFEPARASLGLREANFD
ncbi:type II toxin-antitoxin system prevent-host-death family antitoxin [Glacieibacterium frigidum]|uniref:Antitoxin n=1 Tax=Glacieibacterium frigidum TaxID=2593303 RepID=A0A552U7V7_9SPHN|nr:type II toxin-antitoxin system prevent-host-death family antitoxin [Glacieibacterium frigidum]TRW14302.1 type II toxin-antitoxin system Phd/YefM family antitoxin [Glacieibacterium frigidum]